MSNKKSGTFDWNLVGKTKKLMEKGLNDKEIAEKLSVTEKDVRLFKQLPED